MENISRVSKPVIFLAFGFILVASYAFLIQSLPIADLTKEFGVPAAIGGLVVKAITNGSTAVVIVGILAGFLTGGLGLIANAGRTALVTYLKKELRKRGEKAFIAW